ncbi:MAG TPA: DUF6502 family protein [Rhodocyclaceae bacterium]|nr:DUF6502 family protein [Rhodocyclaceae bacterium]
MKPTGAADAKPKSEQVLEASVATLLPLVRYLLLEGVNYPLFVRALKPVFVRAAQLELEKSGVKINDSSVSLLSGLHRKDIRELNQTRGASVSHSGPVSSLVFTKWISDPVYVQKNGKPRRLPLRGPAPSFESLALEITQDVHPGSVLKSMEAQGMVSCEGEGGAERVVLLKDSFIPRDDLGEMLAMFAANLQDHLAAATSNLKGGGPPFLEQAVFGSELSEASIAKLAGLSRRLWEKHSLEIIREASRLCEADQGCARPQRFRLGNYFYATAIAAAQSQGAASDTGSDK